MAERAALQVGAATVRAAVERPLGYLPGESVHATVTLLVARDAAADLPAHTLEVQCTGVEHLDASWVTPSERHEADAALPKGERYTFRTRPVTLFSACSLTPGERRSFHVQFTLPHELPPSFRGTFARFTYTLTATLSSAAPGAAPATLSLPLRVWPLPGGAPAEKPASPPRLPLPLFAARRDTMASLHRPSPNGSAAADSHALCDVLSWEEGDSDGASAALLALGGPLSGRLSGTGAHAAALESPRIGASDSASPLFGQPLPLVAPAADAVPQSPRALPRDSSGITPRRHGSMVSPSPLAISESSIGEGGDGSPYGVSARLAAAGAHAPPAPAGPPRAAHYAVRCGTEALVRVQLRQPGPCVAAGGTVAGTLDFWESHGAEAPALLPPKAPLPLRCVAVAISLDTEERVEVARAVAGRRRGGSASAGHALRRVRDECAEVTADTLCTSFAFSVPADAPPSFTAGPITHAWCLAFEFTLAPRTPGGAADTLRWSLPLTIGAPTHRDARDAAAATL